MGDKVTSSQSDRFAGSDAIGVAPAAPGAPVVTSAAVHFAGTLDNGAHERGANDPDALDGNGRDGDEPMADVAPDQTLLQFAASQSPAVLYIGTFSESGRLSFVSDNAQSVLGWSPEDLTGPASSWRDLLHPDDVHSYERGFEAVRRDGAGTYEYRMRTSTGAYRWIRDQQRLTSKDDPRREFVGCIIDITAEKEAAFERDRANAINRAVVAAACDAIITTDGEGRVIDFNPAAERTLGYTADEAQGQCLCDLIIPPAVRNRTRESFEAFCQGLPTSEFADRFETALCRADGSEFPAELRACLVDVGGEKIVVTELRDLTERAEAEATERKLMQYLQQAVDAMPAAFSMSDPDGRIVVCNKLFSDAYGLSVREIVGMARADLIPLFEEHLLVVDGKPVETSPRAYRDALERISDPESDPLEVKFKNGEWKLVSSSHTADGGFVTIRTDITRLKQAETALRDSEYTIRMAVEACPVPLGLVRLRDGRLLYESPAGRRLFRRTPSSEPATTVGMFVDDDERRAFLKKARDGGVDEYEILLRRIDGEEFWASMSARVIDFQGEESIVSSIYDLTERRAIEDEISRQREALHQGEKLAALGELLASVAHELNNPLSVVVGQALLLKETATDKAIAARAEKIGSAADRCSRIVRTFLAMARQQPMERRPVDVNRVVELALEVTAYSLRANDIDIRLSLADGMPTIWGDADQLNQVLTNLILNAQKALEEKAPGEKTPGETGDRRRIKIVTDYRERSREVVIKIKDNGPGIPEKIRSRIFEPFFTTRQVGTGTGIGLAFCHRTITTHGGTICVETGIDGGASFVIRLPVTRMGDTGPEPVEADYDTSPAATILVVDDEVAVAEMMADILADDGHSVEIAHSGSQALDIIEKRPFDLVLSDLRMPDLDGPAMFDAIREARQDLVSRIAFITGDTMSTRIRDFLQVSRRPYIEKPIAPQDVRDLVNQMLRERRPSFEELEQ